MKKLTLTTAMITSIMLFSSPAVAQNLKSVFLEGKTDSTGRFTISHQYLAEPNSCEGTLIAGATVAIRNSGNKEWYTLVDRNENWHAIAWGDRKVSGYFNRPGYENQPVRVVLFLTNRIC